MKTTRPVVAKKSVAANRKRENPVQSQEQKPAQLKANQTGMPDNLKAGIENLSGYSMNDVKVHHNSSKPAQLNAHAYAQGTDIHVAPGQEKHVPHEAWHVVQQKQGRVKPTRQMKGKVPVNDDKTLEQEADTMGHRALQTKADTQATDTGPVHTAGPVAQLNKTTKRGMLGSVALGGLIGSMINPGLGTIVGAGIGGLVGFVGGYVYDKKRKQGPFTWKLYINPKDFDEANESWNPGGMYDKQQSPGYQASMVKAIQEELFGHNLGTVVDYEEYVRLHNVVTSKLQSDGKRLTTTLQSIRTASSVEAGTAFPITDWETDEPVMPADDLMEEEVDGLPMVKNYRHKMPLPNEKDHEDNRSVTVFDKDENGGTFNVRYNEEEGKQIVQSILRRYYTEIKGSHGDDELKLDAIVKVIRALHVAHPFKDANGRLHCQILLNRFLLEQGFDITILPKQGLGVFGGGFSIPQLKAMVKRGFRTRKQIKEDR